MSEASKISKSTLQPTEQPLMLTFKDIYWPFLKVADTYWHFEIFSNILLTIIKEFLTFTGQYLKLTSLSQSSHWCWQSSWPGGPQSSSPAVCHEQLPDGLQPGNTDVIVIITVSIIILVNILVLRQRILFALWAKTSQDRKRLPGVDTSHWLLRCPVALTKRLV